MSVSEFSERDLIDVISDILGEYYTRIPFGYLDDAGALRILGKWFFLKIDGTSFRMSRYPWMGFDDVAYRVALGAAIDVIAKGGTPVALTASIGLQREMSLEDVKEVARGLRDSCQALKALFLGGDLNVSEDGWLDVAVLGVSRTPISNKGLKPGYKVYSTRCLGISSIPALTHYEKILGEEILKKFLKTLKRPDPPLKFLKVLNEVKASTDVSDGLESLRRVLRMNDVAMKLYRESVCEEVLEISEQYSIDLKMILRYMGEEYSIVIFTDKEMPDDYVLVGEVVEGPSGLIYLGEQELHGGWDNLRGWL
ncbi:MAG: AIR synthase related protein [Desulfurococcaceae archaeon TW002]